MAPDESLKDERAGSEVPPPSPCAPSSKLLASLVVSPPPLTPIPFIFNRAVALVDDAILAEEVKRKKKQELADVVMKDVDEHITSSSIQSMIDKRVTALVGAQGKGKGKQSPKKKKSKGKQPQAGPSAKAQATGSGQSGSSGTSASKKRRQRRAQGGANGGGQQGKGKGKAKAQ
ncbi:hypothetical protein AGABI1DRAFT_134305 [Agaricus bisporus var. burnettii JB137-S8]|uniref:Uncharacterized protein n=1 Tax=Agaricus bisporus var. burnettii (strain JB137-S8 / ATCC MYA-4627 / FGSC 10392) TaxID=597362 RepID=K5VH76_AGABU|nr:uncharacterized protein AGABI1DRAFT_134305 [Agaricus bisporus var. burnettii JB137-S8]EKM73669.1 hypothetical protein AGABI1DRAFT_134305 [Agaricus bisporus var. burnettii JB137-S8]